MSEPTKLFCKDCKWVLGRRDNLDQSTLWKCTAPGNIVSSNLNPVTGEYVTLFKATYCDSARKLEPPADVCGPDGKWFEKYERPSFVPAVVDTTTGQLRPKKATLKDISADDL